SLTLKCAVSPSIVAVTCASEGTAWISTPPLKLMPGGPNEGSTVMSGPEEPGRTPPKSNPEDVNTTGTAACLGANGADSFAVLVSLCRAWPAEPRILVSD